MSRFFDCRQMETTNGKFSLVTITVDHFENRTDMYRVEFEGDDESAQRLVLIVMANGRGFEYYNATDKNLELFSAGELVLEEFVPQEDQVAIIEEGIASVNNPACCVIC